MNSLLKMLDRYCRWVPLVVAITMLAGCGTPQYAFRDAGPADTNAKPVGSTLVSAPPAVSLGAQTNTNQTADLLRLGDRLTITISAPGMTAPQKEHEERIREDGNINPPLLRRTIKAAGKTIGQLQDELQNLYVPAYFTSATITVQAAERYFFVSGEVKNAGQKPYLSEMTVMKAIQAAGGFDVYANRKKVQITRADGHSTDTINCEKALKTPKLDKPIYPGDQVFVPQRRL